MPSYKSITLLLVSLFLLTACTGIPEGITPVTNFKLNRYLGKWYEIARLDHSFERNLTHVTATYEPGKDEGIRVINRGYNSKDKKWEKAIGKAYFIESPDTGRLKVSFFGPFYGGYNIFELDHNDYQYSLVCGADRSYLWILARQPELDKDLIQQLVQKAKALGFATDQLIFVDHSNLPEK